MRLAVFLVLAGTLAVIGAPSAAATNECRGLQVCVRVAGPWVVVPAGLKTPRAHVDFRLSCPRGYLAAGLDTELTDQAIDVEFAGKIGSPVNPGVTTSRAVVFRAAVLRAAVLRPAVLRAAVLRPAVLRATDLRATDLRAAVLRAAVLRVADLRRVVLRAAAVLRGRPGLRLLGMNSSFCFSRREHDAYCTSCTTNIDHG